VPASTAVDSDINDPNAPFTRNNAIGQEQPIPNPVTLGGFAADAPTGLAGDRFEFENDEEDGYRITLYQGQTITLQISDHIGADPLAIDLDLVLFETGTGNAVQSSLGIDAIESITVNVPDGTYDLVIFAFSGASNYTLSIGQASVQAERTLRLEDEFVPNEALIRLNPSLKNPQKTLSSFSSLGASIKGGDAGRIMRLDLGAMRHPALAGGPGTVRSALKRSGRLSAMSPSLAEKYETIAALKALRARSDIESADLNYIHKPQLTPNDQYYNLQWHYPLINLPQAWNVTTGAPASGDIIVAVVDTGVLMTHPDLTPNLLNTGYDFISNPVRANDGGGIDNNPNDPGDNASPGSSSFHGTHVAGTIAAASNNSTGVSGVSWNAKIMPIRVLGIGGGTDYDIVQGIRYAAGLSNDSGTVPPQKADIINLSLGGPGSSQTVQNEYNAVRAAGAIIIAAAGNENSSAPFFPAAYNGVVSVAAVGVNKQRAPYSNFNSQVDVAAPGGNTAVDLNGDGFPDGVLSTLANDAGGSFYGFYQGTSMAAPHMAGVVALMKAIKPDLTPDQLDTLLVSGGITEDTGGDGPTVRNNNFGYGLIDALKAVEAATNLVSGALPQVVSVNPTLLNFGNASTALNFTLANAGSGSPAVTGVADDTGWLNVTATAVDGSGFGTYTATVDRTGLIDATYSATITVNTSIPSTVHIPVAMIVGTTPLAADSDAGLHYIILLDATDFTNLSQTTASVDNGVYQYQFNNVAPGGYYIVAGTDMDNDFVLCDPGESCGIYPTTGLPGIVEIIDANLSGIDFVTSFVSGFGAGAAGSNAAPAREYRRIQHKSVRLP
jgi:serine protease